MSENKILVEEQETINKIKELNKDKIEIEKVMTVIRDGKRMSLIITKPKKE